MTSFFRIRLIPIKTEMTPGRILWQDVTDVYRSLYPALEKAYCLQSIPGETL